MLVSCANNQTMVSQEDTSTVIYTDPYPIGDANHIEISFNVHRLFAEGGTPTIAWAVEGSNDGQNFYPVAGLNGSTGAEDLTTGSGNLASVFIRFKFTLTIAGGAGISGTTFDCHGNLKHI